MNNLIERFDGMDEITVAFSGGKDSTLVLLLALKHSEINGTKVKVVFNDTLGEMPNVKLWVEMVRKAIEDYVEFIVTKPLEPMAFWWGLAVKGYPPPNWKFRWCTKFLKTLPFRRTISNVVVIGVRKSESKQRSRKNISTAFEEEGMKKYAPIYDLSEEEVWEALDNLRPFALRIGFPDPRWLRKLYHGDVRFGCWFCTVVKRQNAIDTLRVSPFVISGDLKVYLNVVERLRQALMRLRNEEREEKGWGYTKRGPLTKKGRAIAYSLFVALSQKEILKLSYDDLEVDAFYGLKEKGPLSGKSYVECMRTCDVLEVEEEAKSLGYFSRLNRKRLEEFEEVRKLGEELLDEAVDYLMNGKTELFR